MNPIHFPQFPIPIPFIASTEPFDHHDHWHRNLQQSYDCTCRRNSGSRTRNLRNTQAVPSAHARKTNHNNLPKTPTLIQVPCLRCFLFQNSRRTEPEKAARIGKSPYSIPLTGLHGEILGSCRGNRQDSAGRITASGSSRNRLLDLLGQPCGMPSDAALPSGCVPTPSSTLCTYDLVTH